jgi:uncharacterized protein YjiS (DUF1127 family)
MPRTTKSPRASDAAFNFIPCEGRRDLDNARRKAWTAFPLPPPLQGVKAGGRGSPFGWLGALAATSGGRMRTCIAEWRRRARSRHDLMALGDHELWDMHLTRCDALYEASKPFWKE